MKKRVQVNVEIEEYTELMQNIKAAGLKNRWFGEQVCVLIKSLNHICRELALMKEKGDALTEKEGKALIVATAEQAFGVKMSDFTEK